MATRWFLPPLFLAAVCLLVWCTLTARWTVEAWHTPLDLRGDALEIYARIQAAEEDLTQPLRGYVDLPRLGAPFGADWRRYPVSDAIVFTLLGAVARGVGVFCAVNLAMAVVHALNALSFFLTARYLRWKTSWAFALALLFSFSSYNFGWAGTLSLSLTFALPPLLLLCAWIARSAPALRSRGWTWLAVALGFWLGGANPYLGFFAAQLVGLSLALQAFRRRDPVRCRPGIVFFVILLASFTGHHAPYFLAPVGDLTAGALERNYAGSEIYALKLIDLIVPPAEHFLTAFGAIGRAYHDQSALRTEFFVNYLGVAGMLGLALLVRAGLRGAVARTSRVPDAFLGVAWLATFSAVGGLNSVLALAGFDLFRATNRCSVFVLLWSLFFLGAWCQRRQWLRKPVLAVVVPVIVAAVGILDCVPTTNASVRLRDNAAALRAARELTSQLERRLGRDAHVFQLPAIVFPEAGSTAQMTDYEHFLPYLCSTALRFSYGALRGTTAARANVALAQLPPDGLKMKLETSGFDAIWLDRRGFPAGGTLMTERLRALGLPEFPQTAAPHVTIFLLPSAAAAPEPNLYDPDLFPLWDPASSADDIRLAAIEGWYPLEREGSRAWRWAENIADMSFELPSSGTALLTFHAWSRADGDLILDIDGHEQWRRPTSRRKSERLTIEIKLGAGSHHLRWRYTGGTKRGSSKDPRQLGFALENVALTFAPATR